MTGQKVPKGCKQTEVGVIPEDWAVTEVSGIASPVKNAIVGGPFGSDLVSSDYVEEGIPVIRGQNMGERYISGNFVFVTQEKARSLESNLAQAEDLLFTQRGTLGQVSIVPPNSFPRYLISQSQMKLTVSKKIADPLFFYYVFSSSEQQKYVQLNTIQTGVPHVNLGILRTTPVQLPPIAEQKLIARALSDIDALIEALEGTIGKKRHIKQGAMQELLRSGADWIEYPFSDVCWFQEGPGVRNHQFTTSGVKLFNGTNIEKGNIDLDKTNRYISEKEAFGWYSHFMADAGDIVIACSGISIDKFDEKVSVIEVQHLPLCMNTSTMRFKVNPSRIDKSYLQHFLRSNIFKEQIGGKATGSAQLNFGPSHVSAVKIRLPELSEQEAIATILSDMDTEIATLEAKLTKTRQLKQGMMHELLTGRIRLV